MDGKSKSHPGFRRHRQQRHRAEIPVPDHCPSQGEQITFTDPSPEPDPREGLTPGSDVFRQASSVLKGRKGRGWLGRGRTHKAVADPSFETSASLSG